MTTPISQPLIVRRILALLAGVALLMSLLTLAPTRGDAQGYGRDPAFQEFYQTLDAHGEWVVHPRYGETWVPFANQDREWRPYTRGQWVYTEEHGWYWESDEEFGWVVYHYGRWLLDRRHGWMWVPGREWGPAWVAWREGESAIGWAPLPPEAEFDGAGQMTFEAYASPQYASMWMFVAPALLTMPAVYRHFHPWGRSSFYFGQTRHATYYGYRDRHVYNRGIDRRFVELHMRRPVPVREIRPGRDPRDVVRRQGDGDRRPVVIYRPALKPVPPTDRPPVARPGFQPPTTPMRPVEPARRLPFGGDDTRGRPPEHQPSIIMPRGPQTGPGPGPGPGFGEPRQPRPPFTDDRRPNEPPRQPGFNPGGPTPGVGLRPPGPPQSPPPGPPTMQPPAPRPTVQMPPPNPPVARPAPPPPQRPQEQKRRPEGQPNPQPSPTNPGNAETGGPMRGGR